MRKPTNWWDVVKRFVTQTGQQTKHRNMLHYCTQWVRRTHQLMGFLCYVLFSQLHTKCGQLVVDVPYKLWNIQLSINTNWHNSAAFSAIRAIAWRPYGRLNVPNYALVECPLSATQAANVCRNYGCTKVWMDLRIWHHLEVRKKSLIIWCNRQI